MNEIDGAVENPISRLALLPHENIEKAPTELGKVVGAHSQASL